MRDVRRFCPRFFELIQKKINYFSLIGFVIKQLLPSVWVPCEKYPTYRFRSLVKHIPLFTSISGISCQLVYVCVHYVGMEVAAYLSDKATSVTVIGRSAIPFANVLGKEIGTLLKKVRIF